MIGSGLIPEDLDGRAAIRWIGWGFFLLSLLLNLR
jgi:hypothetical protein